MFTCLYCSRMSLIQHRASGNSVSLPIRPASVTHFTHARRSLAACMTHTHIEFPLSSQKSSKLFELNAHCAHSLQHIHNIRSLVVPLDRWSARARCSRTYTDTRTTTTTMTTTPNHMWLWRCWDHPHAHTRWHTARSHRHSIQITCALQPTCLTIRMSNSPHIYSTLCRAHFIQIVKTPIYFNLRYTRRYFFFFNAILINGSVYTSNAINFGTGTHSAGVFVCTYSRYVQRDIIKWEGNLYM